jgi:hypothetical protein
MEPQVRWAHRVEETFNKLRYADRDAQELACKSIQEEFGSEEAGAKLRELFETDRAKLLERAAEITVKIENGKTEAEASNPKVQPIRLEPKVGAWRFVQKADGSKWWVKGNDWRRHFGPPPTRRPEEKKAAVALKVVEQRKPEPEPEPEPEEPEAKLPAVMPSVAPAPAWDQAIAAMNRQHAIIENVGGKAVIASWEPSSLDPKRLVVVFQNKESFLLRYSNRSVSIEIHDGRGGTVRVPLGQWWLSHRDRQQYRGVTFRPGGPKTVGELLNLWQDWGVEGRAGDWGLIRNHIREVIAGGNNEFADYIIRWIAWAIQNPAAQAEVALVLIGLKGACCGPRTTGHGQGLA